MDEVSFLKKIIEIYSPTGEEKQLSTFLMERMERLGFKTQMDKAGNIIGTIGEGKPSILLCSHMDTVPGKIPVKIINGKLYGRGSVDAKSSLAAMIMAASRVESKLSSVNGKISVVGTVDEEGNSKGIRTFLREKRNFNCALFGEPTNLKYITIGYKGRLGLKIRLKVKQTHSASPTYLNAISKLMQLHEKIKRKLSRHSSKSLYKSFSLNIHQIKGNDIECKTKTSIRIPIKHTCKETIAWINSEMHKFTDANPNVKVKIEIEEMTDPFEANKKTLLIKTLVQVIKEELGINPRLIRKTGTGDMNVFGNKTGIPTATYGPGDSRLDHSPTEHVNLKHYLKAINIYEKLIIRLLNTHSKLS